MDVVTAQDQFNSWIQGGRYDLFANKFKLVVDKDIRMVQRSDFIIVHLFPDIGTTGTIHEMAEAWRIKKPIYLIYYGAKSRLSKWALFLTTDSGGKVFSNKKQCLDYIDVITEWKRLSLRQQISQLIKSVIRGIGTVLYDKKMNKIKIKNETKEERNKRLKEELEANAIISNRKNEWPNAEALTPKSTEQEEGGNDA